MTLVPNPRAGYSFLPGGSPYSRGVIAADGFTIEHVRLARLLPWRAGFELVERRLSALGRPPAALCAIALRSPEPFSFDGFREFNAGYVEVLKSLGVLLDGANPVARTNVAPEVDPPAEPSLYSFAYTVPAAGAPVSFVVSGAGEMPEGSRDPADVVRRGETSRDALADKARCVMDLVDGRLRGLGATWDGVTATNMYTVHDVGALLPTEILARMGSGRRHGVNWHFTRPPILTIEFEMDVRGCRHELVMEAGN